jgi:hypothetical protein
MADALVAQETATVSDETICHNAVRAVERGLPLASIGTLERMSDNVYAKAEYLEEENPLFENILAHIEKAGLPCVVVISTRSSDLNQDTMQPMLVERPIHSFIVREKDEASGEMQTWEKQGSGRPYRASTLTEMYERWSKVHGHEGTRVVWGTRPIHKSP